MASNGLKNIADIFERNVFRIPDYQRGYSWTKKQLSDFWEDIENLPKNHIHYMAVLTLEKVKESVFKNWEEDMWLIEGKGYSPYHIVDGQQRLMTVIILIQTIIEKIEKGQKLNYNDKKAILEKYIYQSRNEGISQTCIFGYEKDNPSYEFLKTKIFGISTNANQGIETLYTANLEFAKNFFLEKIRELSFENIEALFKKVTQLLKFNVYEVEEDLDVFVTFETMNNRGKKLSNLELMKNRLIYLSTLCKVDQYEKNALRENINNVWKTIYEYLGKNKLKKLDDDIFLKNHWIMYFKYSRTTANAYIDFLLEEYFTTKNLLENKLSMKNIQDYITSMQDSAKIWFDMHNPILSPYNNEIKKWLIKLNNLEFKAFGPLTMAILHRFNDYENSEITNTLKAMERYIFLVFDISRRPSNVGDSNFYRFAKEFYSGETELQSVKREIKIWIDGDSKKWKGYYKLSRFFEFIKEKFERKDGGFYGWNGLKYVLYEYDYFLQEEAEEERKKIDWVEFNKIKTNYITIEHIYPQTSNKKCWDKFFENYSEDQKYKLCHSIGNLVPLSQKKNSSLQNDCFDQKKHQTSGETGYFNGSYSENEVAQYGNWTPEEILNRGLKILSFIEHRWDIEFGSDEEKKKLLNLEFLN